jgi:hypothetical protein
MCLYPAGVLNKKALKIPMASRSFVPFIFCPILAVVRKLFFANTYARNELNDLGIIGGLCFYMDTWSDDFYDIRGESY